MSRLPSRVESIIKIADKIRNLSPDVSTEGLFVEVPSSDLFLLIPLAEFTLEQLNQVKTELRRGDDFKIGERRYIDADLKLATVIGVAFVSDELLPKYGLEMGPTGRIAPLRK